MLYLYIGAAIVIGLLTVFVFLSVVLVARRVGDNIRMRSSEIISSYDELLGKKSEALGLLRKEILEKKQELEELNEKKKVLTLPQSEKTGGTGFAEAGRILQDADERIRETEYVDRNTAEIYQKIREGFDYTPEAVLNSLKDQSASEPGPAGKLLKELPYEMVAELAGLSSGEQLGILRDSFSKQEQQLLQDYLHKVKEFRIIGFYDYLKSRAKTENTPACVYVAPSIAGRKFAADVDVILDDSLCEGFQIEMNNKRYDYSVTKREIS